MHSYALIAALLCVHKLTTHFRVTLIDEDNGTVHLFGLPTLRRLEPAVKNVGESRCSTWSGFHGAGGLVLRAPPARIGWDLRLLAFDLDSLQLRHEVPVPTCWVLEFHVSVACPSAPKIRTYCGLPHEQQKILKRNALFQYIRVEVLLCFAGRTRRSARTGNWHIRQSVPDRPAGGARAQHAGPNR